nr:aminotransferase class V-fold PLP-dependent enzyme [Paraburkholderia sp. BL8N3]
MSNSKHLPSRALPEQGTDWNALREQMLTMRIDDIDWRAGRTPLHIYFAGDEVLKVAREAYGMFMSENALAPAAFPSLRQMEQDVLGIAIDLLGGGVHAAGSFTSGGTESIILAVRSAAKWFADVGRLSSRSHLLIPESAHPAFDKASELLGLSVRRYPIDASYRGCATRLSEQLDADTMMTVASVPCLPFGTVDPVAEIAEITRRHDIWLHVDACIGGFLAPFAKMLGSDLADWDLRVPGVRSLSADLHKYGYTAKGASVVLYANVDDRNRQFFDFDEWPKGRYLTETLTGTRSGGAVAAAWAVMHHLGTNGYKTLARRVIDTRARLQREIALIPGFHLLGVQPLGLLAFTSSHVDIFAVADQMEDKGWYISRVGRPPALQMTVTPAHEGIVDAYVRDLRESVQFVTDRGIASRNRSVVTY